MPKHSRSLARLPRRASGETLVLVDSKSDRFAVSSFHCYISVFDKILIAEYGGLDADF